MKQQFRSFFITLMMPLVVLVLSSFTQQPRGVKFPWAKAGLTDKEAAAYLLSRFSFGATPGQVDAVAKMGVENWFIQQLDAKQDDSKVNDMLKQYPALSMSNEEILNHYPRNGQLLKFVSKDSAKGADFNKRDYRDEIRKYMQENNLKPQFEMYKDLISQKILLAAYSNNQLREVLTDFWFNHFNVSLTKGEDRSFVLTYERDVIRPNVTANFEDLLMATAKSPAMLTYLDNFRSAGSADDMNPQQKARQEEMMRQMEDTDSPQAKEIVKRFKANKNNQGLNENYAREIMELHTLGVDGGYTQADVTNAAKVLTGWTLYPMGDYAGLKKFLDKMDSRKFEKAGFVHEGDFLFAANRHDKSEKVVLGHKFAAGGGYEEGMELIHMLATHPSTAKFISRKLATRFVSDQPSQALIDKMAKTFLDKKGSIREVLLTMVSSPEFWNKSNLREKTKSPFELAISSIRTINAEIVNPYQLYTWVTKMGQQVYYYQAPTGFPDRGQYWINTGSLLNRMNFGLALASGRIPGVKADLSALNQHHEPESAEAALTTYARILLPGRDIDETVERLTPVLKDPEFNKNLEAAANRTAQQPVATDEDPAMMSDRRQQRLEGKPGKKQPVKNEGMMMTSSGDNGMIAQVVGVIIGSPEFQRR